MLRTLVLRRGNDTRRDVRNADGGFDFIDVLPALAAGTVGIDLQLDGWNDNVRVGLGNFSNAIHAGETGVATFIRVKWRKSAPTDGRRVRPCRIRRQIRLQ